MGFFSKKPPAEKAAKADEKKRRAERQDAIKQHLKKVERLSAPAAISHTSSLLTDDETVLFAFTGEETSTDATAVVVLTDQRIIIGAMKGLSIVDMSLDYSTIDRVDVGIGLKGSWVHFHQGSRKTEVKGSPHGQLTEVRTIVENQRA